MRTMICLITLACAALLTTGAHAAFLIEVDTDGADDGPFTPSPNFSFGGDTTNASTSIASPALGLTGGDSIFGGDGSAFPDTYVFTYTPGVDADNLALNAGDPLSSVLTASGIVGGGTDTYAIYAAWPTTTGVSGGDTQYELIDTSNNGTVFSTTIDQNNQENAWIRLGFAPLETGKTYTLVQTPTGQNSFVSMRAAGVLFEIPEPGTLALVGVGGFTGLLRRRA